MTQMMHSHCNTRKLYSKSSNVLGYYVSEEKLNGIFNRLLCKPNQPPFTNTFCILIIITFLAFSATISAAKPTKKQTNNIDLSPMAIEYDRYEFRNLSGDNSCLGEDDALEWKATGSLEPGESFTYTSEVPGCYRSLHAISVTLTWQDSELELSSIIPGNDGTSWDLSQKGKPISAIKSGNSAQLCMFPSFDDEATVYSITVTNTGNSTAKNIVLDGWDKNDWPIYYYNRCMHSDADRDGWNDSFEHSMSQLVYPLGYIDGEFQPYILWGSNYLKGSADTSDVDDEIDSYPPDFSDDGIVNNDDVEEINWYLGEGNGIALETISPNHNIPESYHSNQFAWRRYDLNVDGYVTQADVEIVEKLIGQPVPMTEDTIAPFARILLPYTDEIIPRGKDYRIQGHTWDNAALDKVEYLVDGKTVCSVTNPIPSFGFTSPFNTCWWKTPKRRGQYTLTIRVTDASGNSTTSEPVSVNVE